ncbi:hypothetical protein RJT34_19600 [Clitoria ternatea]|uniref:Uncharacterized protein n=1 Tax=Clitoria ternatea TaxID=43366 RepID=A0AAN9IRA9_CLITE
MRGIGGPLLCIGDLLNDVGEEGQTSPAPPPPPSLLNDAPLPDLTKLFQDNYDHLNSALSGTDHSWTSLTLKLCTALETANQLVQSTNANVASLLEKVEELQKIVKRGDSAMSAAKTVYYASQDNHSGEMK